VARFIAANVRQSIPPTRRFFALMRRLSSLEQQAKPENSDVAAPAPGLHKTTLRLADRAVGGAIEFALRTK